VNPGDLLVLENLWHLANSGSEPKEPLGLIQVKPGDLLELEHLWQESIQGNNLWYVVVLFVYLLRIPPPKPMHK